MCEAMSKGSNRRPAQVSHDEYAKNYDRIFGTDEGTENKCSPFFVVALTVIAFVAITIALIAHSKV